MEYLRLFVEPNEDEIKGISLRNKNNDEVSQIVKNIISKVKMDKDSALIEYEKLFDKVELQSLEVEKEKIENSEKQIDKSLSQAIRIAAKNISLFHENQKPNESSIEVMEGIKLYRKTVALNTVGLYIPGGTAPLFSTVLMLGIPAKIAGCKNIQLCTPPDKNGEINPAILFAAKIAGIDKIFKVGGAQAIAALAYGTQTIKKCDKIFGPGNQYVTNAKLQVSIDCCSIDLPAGPSEVLVVIDKNSNICFAASDLLSQAEHGFDSQSILVINADKEEGIKIAGKVEKELELQMKRLNRKNYLKESLKNSKAVIIQEIKEVNKFINAYAPEHLIINTDSNEIILAEVENAGSVFIGPWSCESAGDYASGTNHTLPTGGWAKSYSGVSYDSFVKKITYQEISQKGLQQLSPTIIKMAEAENLDGHANAVSVRMEEIK